ncbi:olfactory receptor 2AT4-like [Polypterus senegalus]|uniref:olfactory receptor 2AT4-like n=1 Tax=Polypterus senegalus TaxID=55291 RepID=UPI0019669445|nr:olfactory receptor 2AT4-like [Polypterus senegalus]
MVQEFIIAGFPGFQDRFSRNTIFGTLLTIYIFILLGNLLIIMIFLQDKELHVPMYILISNLALVDIIISSTTIPNMLSLFRSGSISLSLPSCFMQMFFYGAMTTAESLLLGLMAYDRYVAICKPLHYYTITSNSLVLKQIVCCWLCVLIIMIIPVTFTFKLHFCGPNIVLHCFCDNSAVLKLACSNTTPNTYVVLSIGLLVMIGPLIYILFSYTRIIISVLHISSSEGRLKAFSTCGSHLLVLLVFFLVGAGVYIANRVPSTSVDVRILASLIQNVTPPLLNPIIYCWRTKDIQDSIRKVLKINKILPNKY